MRSIIVITGTPGTGKTTLARSLKRRLKGSELIEVNELVKKEKLFGGYAKDGARLVNVARLSKSLQEKIKEGKARTVILEGHLLCEIKIRDATVIVLRSHLKELEKRLAGRRYKESKLLDNIISEGLDYCGIKASENYSKVFELIGTRKQLLDSSLKIVSGRVQKGKSIELIDELKGNRYLGSP